MWSIGIFEGSSPFTLKPLPGLEYPAVSAHGVTDVNAVSIADPFMIKVGLVWYMFFEALDGDTQKGCIGFATSSDALTWKYQSIVLNESFHLSYPYVFEYECQYYMVPEAYGGGGVHLYRANNFPYDWSRERTLIEGNWADSSVFRFNDRWWMFTCGTPQGSDTLHLFHSHDLFGPWAEHPCSPLKRGDKRASRPAGRVVVSDGKVVRFAQDCEPKYGTKVRAFEVTTLDMNHYQEREHPFSPILEPSGVGWNSERMHHVDPHLVSPHRWLACVDGLTPSRTEPGSEKTNEHTSIE